MYHQDTLPHRKTLREKTYARKSKRRNAKKAGKMKKKEEKRKQRGGIIRQRCRCRKSHYKVPPPT